MKLEMALGFAELTKMGEVAARIEAQGFDGAFSFEGPHDPFFPIVLAAQQTERIELGTAIAVAFARNPMLCAQIAQDLQRITRGRFYLGLGSQVKPHIERRFSQPWSKPAARMREFVQAIRAIWHTWNTKERLDFRGEFYTHTLMTPAFNPGPNPFGDPKIFLAAVGPKMVGITGEVADGLLVHPFHTGSYVAEETIPALEQGLARAGRKRSEFEITVQTVCMMGSNDEEIARARQKAKAQLSFYGSTPAYKVVLDHHGWGDLQPTLNRMSKEGRWLEMVNEISDDIVDAMGVSGTPADVGRRLAERNDFAERTSLVLYNETDPDAVVDLVRAAREAG